MKISSTSGLASFDSTGVPPELSKWYYHGRKYRQFTLETQRLTNSGIRLTSYKRTISLILRGGSGPIISDNIISLSFVSHHKLAVTLRLPEGILSQTFDLINPGDFFLLTLRLNSNGSFDLFEGTNRLIPNNHISSHVTLPLAPLGVVLGSDLNSQFDLLYLSIGPYESDTTIKQFQQKLIEDFGLLPTLILSEKTSHDLRLNSGKEWEAPNLSRSQFILDVREFSPVKSASAIALNFENLSLKTQYCFKDAAEHWNSIIQPLIPVKYQNQVISAVQVHVKGSSMNRAGVLKLRSLDKLPLMSQIAIDESTPNLEIVALRAIGHALGLGSLWNHFELVEGDSYFGISARIRHNRLFRLQEPPKVELNGLWSTGIGDVMAGDTPGISEISAGGLIDIGYRVSFDFCSPPVENLAAPATRFTLYDSPEIVEVEQIKTALYVDVDNSRYNITNAGCYSFIGSNFKICSENAVANCGVLCSLLRMVAYPSYEIQNLEREVIGDQAFLTWDYLQSPDISFVIQRKQDGRWYDSSDYIAQNPREGIWGARVQLPKLGDYRLLVKFQNHVVGIHGINTT